jgi:cellulose synthase/poly-beta-1,6-N-acetylglucosamine synthase-like glycosyltransferase
MLTFLCLLPLLPAVWAYALYPALTIARARRLPPPSPPPAAGKRPRLSACFAAHAEGERAVRKLENLCDLAANGEGPDEILLFVDGEDGKTERLARAFADARGPETLPAIRVFSSAECRGKPACLNDLAREATGDLLVFMDTRQRIEKGALKALADAFADPAVGVASGALQFESGETAASHGASGYWAGEKRLRAAESRLGSVPGATGALYAIRRGLFLPIDDATILDDVLIPMQAVLRGKRCVFVEAARVWDAPEKTYEGEEARKRRTLAGNWQLLSLCPALASPTKNPAFVAFWSHKLLRLVLPFSLALSVLFAGLAAVRGQIWGMAYCAAAVLGAAAAATAHAVGNKVRNRWLGLLGGLWSANLVLLLAAFDALRGNYDPRWKKK